jgi:uncharacterized membrane protein (DUF4010 family)
LVSAVDLIQSLWIALGIGLLIGAERERRKTQRTVPATAGLRTFTLAALLGAIAMLLGDVPLLAVSALCATTFAAVSYWRYRDESDPGITTEFALVTTVLLGALSVRQPALAGSAAVVVTIVLAARQPLHRFVGQIIREGEVADLLILAGATLVILPLLPDRPIGPFQAVNPHALWLVAILILAINAAGHVATRWLGARLGVPLLGLVSGFVSSTATIGAMGAWVRSAPPALLAGSAAAVLSTVATFVQLGLVINVTDHATFQALIAPIIAAILAALLSGASFTLLAWRQPSVSTPEVSRSFGIMMALVFSVMLGVMLVLVSALRAWFCEPGMLVAAAIAGALDVHAAAMAIASQVADGAVPSNEAIMPMLVAWSSSTAAKIVLAASAGPRAFGIRVISAQLFIIMAAWLAARSIHSFG